MLTKGAFSEQTCLSVSKHFKKCVIIIDYNELKFVYVKMRYAVE